MIKSFFASIRLAFGLVCVGAGLILSCQWLGLIPDVRQLETRARTQQCETLAIASAAMVRANQWSQLQGTLRAAASRDESILSIGIRSRNGQLRADSGQHRRYWPEALKSKSYQTIFVPITLNQRPWGQVEFCFVAPDSGGVWATLNHPTIKLLAYFIGAGIFVYALFMARVMGVFNSTQVVPDRVRQALDTLAEGLLVLDESERIILANRAFGQTVGLAPDALSGRQVSSLNWIIPDQVAPESLPWQRAVTVAAPQTDQILRYRLEDNRECVFSINTAPIQASDGNHRGALVTLRDVTHVEAHRAELETMLKMLRSSRDEISRKNRELEVLATQDGLTGCLNRRAFFDRFAINFRFAQQADLPMACIMVDNDHFKSINDTYGHHIGDDVLREVGATLHRLHRDTHLVCRYGGEEFCILLPGYGMEEAAEAAEKIRLAIMDIRLEEPAELRLSASLGVTDLRFGASDPQEMINQADTCLYIAKRQGRNQVVCFDPSMALVEVDDSKIKRLESRVEAQASIHKQPVEATLVVPQDDNHNSIPYSGVSALVSALSYRDSATAEHSRRVADLCVRVANGLLDQRQIFILETAALLHDIGKIGVPDQILLKPGPLSDDEWQIMKRHDRIGVEIVDSAFNCTELTETIRAHYTHYNEEGADHDRNACPEVAIKARILAIADSYDVMVSPCGYRKSYSHAEAVAELYRCAGTQFDPELVDRFVASLQDLPDAQQLATSSVPKVMAMQIGQQIERLANAIDTQDTRSLQVLAARLREVAHQHHGDEIAVVAGRIEHAAAEENVQWMQLLRDTHSLLELCRSTQNAYLCNNHAPSNAN